MTEESQQFDAFYKDARERLLLQTYALTGDLPAARNAVRDAFVIAWHHWRKARRSGDPEAWTRPHAWAHAQRRHTARIWHRAKNLDPEVRATLDALGKLTVAQRKMLLLTVLATGTLADFAREVGLTREVAERELQTATAQLAIARSVATPTIRTLFLPLADVVADVRLPRATILRRAGTTRRRTHTAVGAVAAVAVLAASGAAVTDTGGVRPDLAARALTSDGAPVAPRPGRSPRAEPTPEPAITEAALLTTTGLGAVVPGATWRETATHDGTEGDGTVVPCQQDRFADPRGTAALVRTFTAPPTRRPRTPARSVTQLAEVSAAPQRAERAFRTTVGWFAACSDERAQLVDTREVQGVGDDAMVLALREWGTPATTVVAAVARTGAVTTTTVASVRGTDAPDLRSAVRLLRTAVDGVCELPDAGACPVRPRMVPVDPLPTGEAPGMLVEVDLPPASRVDRPWVGTQPAAVRQNFASTRCDEASFTGPGWRSSRTRTFLVPGAKLPAQFGLTQTVGLLPTAAQARAFVDGVRKRMAGCPERDLGTDVAQVVDLRDGPTDIAAWQVTTEISDQRSVQYLMALVRTGGAVGQIGFVPAEGVTIARDDFVALAERAVQRLRPLAKQRR